MQIKVRSEGDIERLIARARREPDAEQKDRYLAAAHACRGVQTAHIQEMLARSRGFVQRWVYAYRDGGIHALAEKDRPGRSPKLPRDREDQLRARLDAGPTPADKRLHAARQGRAAHPRARVRREVHPRRRLPLLRAPGLLLPGPAAPPREAGPGGQKEFKEEIAPLLSDPERPGRRPRQGPAGLLHGRGPFRPAGHHRPACGPRPARGPRRSSRHATSGSTSTPRSSRPRATAWRCRPRCEHGTMNVFLTMLSPGRLAGRARGADHGPGRLAQEPRRWRCPRTSRSCSCRRTPRSSTRWRTCGHYLRSHYLSNRVFDDYDHLLDAGAQAWQDLTPERLKTVCACRYITHEE